MDETDRVELERVEEFKNFVQYTPEVWDFNTWLSVMEDLQEVAYGAHYDGFEPDYRGDSMMMNLLAMHSEIDEMCQEVGWKPWATPRGWVNREALMDEAVDLMHFLANMLKHANATGPELTAAYKRKVLKNLQRQIDGYKSQKGVDKCAYCGRAMEDLSPNWLGYQDNEGRKFCDAIHHEKYQEAFS